MHTMHTMQRMTRERARWKTLGEPLCYDGPSITLSRSPPLPHRNPTCFILALGTLLGLLAAPAANALPILSEVMYDGPSTDGDDVFTEIDGLLGTDFTGWTLVGLTGGTGLVDRTVSLTGAVIPSDGLLVVATAAAAGAVLAARDFVGSVDGHNGPDAFRGARKDPGGEHEDGRH